MSESKEQFRQRIGSVGAEEYNKDGQRPCYPPYMEDASVAVYAEALRDVMRLMERDPGFVAILGPDDIRDFAAERGIDLDAKLD
jgi:hypothetical protein